MVVFCVHCSRFSSVLLSGSLFSGWLKICLYLQLSVICSGQKWLGQREGLPSAFPLQLAFVSLCGEHIEPFPLLTRGHQEPGDSRTDSLSYNWSNWQSTFFSVSWPSDPCSFLALHVGNKYWIEFLEVHWTAVKPQLFSWKWKFFSHCQFVFIWRFPQVPETYLCFLDPSTVIFLRLSRLLLSYLPPYTSEPFLWFHHFTKTYTESHKSPQSQWL